MSTKDFHPDLRAMAPWLPRATVGPRTLKLVRILTDLADHRSSKDVEIEAAGPISVRIHCPAQVKRPSPALLWIHGGGYVFGTAAQEDALCRRFAQELGIVVAAVDYRLAPEHPFPDPLHDCYAALSWLANRPEIDATRIAVGGASAGGGLAAALALLARDRAGVQAAFQLLTYPMLDDRTAARADLDETDHRMWNNNANRFGWQSYTGLPPGSPDISHLAAPARHNDLSGLPPAWIGVGALDLFHEEDLAYAHRLKAAGVQCEFFVADGAFHGFDYLRPKAGVSQTFQTARIKALAAALL
ncbi:alpha/beta hydrolase [Actinomadura scrupuli]|uniref:alpha/beta hydrolase n=1 Tax=Actinomadura scrupuli TaxID=559629 RepID=UPI003D96C4BC